MADIVLFPCQYEMRIPPQRQERLHPREPPWTVWICCAGRPESLPELGGNSLELETGSWGTSPHWVVLFQPLHPSERN